MDLLNEFTALVEALERAGIEYATCGGLAMAVHGYVRATKDIDILVQSDDLEAAFSVAKDRGFDVEGLPLNFDGGQMQVRRLSKIDKESKTLITVDFLLVTDQTRSVWTSRELVSWDTGSTWVVSRRGLIEMKKYAGRDQDLVDIKRLEESANEED